MSRELPVESLAACPVCGAAASSLILQQSEQYIADGLCVHRCDSCAALYLNPRLTLDSVESLEDQSSVYDYTPEQIAEKITIYAGLVGWLEQYAPRRGRLLDIGCNRGLLLEAARRRGWQVVGVELSTVAADRARADFGLTVHQQLEDAAGWAPFDLIVCWHVLEHTYDPVAFLRQVADLLNTDGILALQVPSFDFRDEFERRGESFKLLCAVHNFYFTAQNIAPVMTRAGLAPIEVISNPDDLMLTVIAAKSPPADYRAYIRQLEETLRAKDAHIRELEDLIRRLESGRVMRLLRRLTR